MEKDGSVIFKDWFKKGMTKHPIMGFGLIKNLEIFENRGIAKLNNRLALSSTYTVSTLPISIEKDIDGSTYVATGAGIGIGSVYKNGVVIQTGLANLWDMKIWRDYLWIRHGTVMSAYGPLSQGVNAQWFPNVVTGMTDLYYGKLLVGQDDFLYTTHGNYVAKFVYSTGGIVGVAPTLTPTLTALDLKDGLYATTLIEFGTKILVGVGGGASFSDATNFKEARVYPWNRQAGTLGNPGIADLPIIFNENGLWQMITKANRLFIVAGTTGNVYESDGVNYRKIATLPFIQSGIYATCEYFPNAIEISDKGKLLIGVSVGSDGYSKAGVYEIDIDDPEYPVCLKNVISTGSTVSTTGRISIGVIKSINNQSMMVGWRDGSTYGVDISDYTMYSSYGGVIETDMVKVGSYNGKRTFSQLEWGLAEPLVAGQKIRVSFRRNNKVDYSTPQEWTFEQFTEGLLSFADVFAIADCEYVQLKIELDQATNTLYGSNINLLYVKIW